MIRCHIKVQSLKRPLHRPTWPIFGANFEIYPVLDAALEAALYAWTSPITRRHAPIDDVGCELS